MLGGGNFAFLALYNPTSQSGPTADAERSGRYHLVTMSALDHPNIQLELQGEKPKLPSAIRLGRLREMLEQWSAPAPSPEAPGAVCPGERWYLPGPVARVLPETGLLQLGCDVARFGDDFTAIHVRRGGLSLYHEAANGWSTDHTGERLKEVAYEHAKHAGMDPHRVIVAVDDVGIGGGVVDHLRADGWAAVGVNVCRTAPEPDEYPDLRSYLWFHLAEQAARGHVSFARLPQPVLAELRRELSAPTYTLDTRGRRQVESKDQTKQRLKRSPDNADATLLAYADVAPNFERVAGRVQVP